jgi:hypothetical protein
LLCPWFEAGIGNDLVTGFSHHYFAGTLPAGEWYLRITFRGPESLFKYPGTVAGCDMYKAQVNLHLHPNYSWIYLYPEETRHFKASTDKFRRVVIRFDGSGTAAVAICAKAWWRHVASKLHTNVSAPERHPPARYVYIPDTPSRRVALRAPEAHRVAVCGVYTEYAVTVANFVQGYHHQYAIRG